MKEQNKQDLLTDILKTMIWNILNDDRLDKWMEVRDSTSPDLQGFPDMYDDDVERTLAHLNKLGWMPPLTDDKDLRELSAQYIYECNAGIWKRKNNIWWADLPEKKKAYYYKQADQLHALLSKEYMSKGECEECQAQTEHKLELAKKEERESIYKKLASKAYPEEEGMEFWLTDEEWQALKGGSE